MNPYISAPKNLLYFSLFLLFILLHNKLSPTQIPISQFQKLKVSFS